MPYLKNTLMEIPLWLVWVVALIFVVAGLGSYAVLDNNEGLYAEISREMLRSGDWRHWVIPHVNTLVYMEKPPLLYWLTAISFAVFGESSWSVRLVPALSALATVALMLQFGRAVSRQQESRWAALIFISGLGVMLMARTLMFDMLLTALLSPALMWAYRFGVDASNRRALQYSLAYLALAVLAKGFVGVVLYVGILVCFVASLSSSVADFLKRCYGFWDWGAIAVFFLIAAPWHVLASVVEPFFAWFYFVNEHVLRFLGQREPHDYYSGSWWYYLPRMIIYLFPWSFLLLGLAFSWFRRNGGMDEPVSHCSAKTSFAEHRQLMKFLSCAWIIPVLFFSVSSAKANYYLVIVMPFVAMQLAILLKQDQFGGVFLRICPGVLVGLLFLMIALNTHRIPEFVADFSIWGVDGITFLTRALYVLAASGFLTAALAWRLPKVGVLWYLALPVANLIVLLSFLSSAPQLISSSPIADRILKAYPDRQVLLYRTFDEKSSLPFYLKSPVKSIETGGPELFWGQKLYGGKMILTHEEVAQMMKNKKLVLVVLDRDLQRLQSKAYASHLIKKEQFLHVTLFFN